MVALTLRVAYPIVEGGQRVANHRHSRLHELLVQIYQLLFAEYAHFSCLLQQLSTLLLLLLLLMIEHTVDEEVLQGRVLRFAAIGQNILHGFQYGRQVIHVVVLLKVLHTAKDVAPLEYRAHHIQSGHVQQQLSCFLEQTCRYGALNIQFHISPTDQGNLACPIVQTQYGHNVRIAAEQRYVKAFQQCLRPCTDATRLQESLQFDGSNEAEVECRSGGQSL